MESPYEIAKRLSEYIESGNYKGIYIAWDPSVVSLDNYLTLVVALRDVTEIVGKKTALKSYGAYSVVENANDPYDLFSGTSYATPRFDVKPADDVSTYPRDEVYAMVDKHVHVNSQHVVKSLFDKRFSEQVWGNEIPLSGVQQIFLREHMDDLI